MAVTINASTTSGLQMSSDLSGNLQFQNNGVNLPMGGVAPAFSAYQSANQSITANTSTKITFDTKVYDTNTNYSTSTYQFTPTVAGYYLLTANYNSSATMTGAIISIFKNETSGQSYQMNRAQTTAEYPGFAVSMMVYANGTTDSFACYVNTTASSTSQGGLQFTRFSGCLVRGA